MTDLLWVVLCAVILLLGVCGYLVSLVRALQSSQRKHHAESGVHRSSLEALTNQVNVIENGQVRLGSQVESLRADFDFHQRSLGSLASSVESVNSELDVVKELLHGLIQSNADVDRRLNSFESSLQRVSGKQDALAAVNDENALQRLPVMKSSDFLLELSPEEFFAPNTFEEGAGVDEAAGSGWLTRLLESYPVVTQGVEAYNIFTEKYIAFSPFLKERLANGAELMRSADGYRAIVHENGKIIGHGVLKTGAGTAFSFASIVSFATTVSYFLVARDISRQMKWMNAALTELRDAKTRARQARLEAVYESVRRISQRPNPHDRVALLLLLTDLHEARSDLRLQVARVISGLGAAENWGKYISEAKLRNDVEEKLAPLRALLNQSFLILRLESFVISIMGDDSLSASFGGTVTDELERLEQLRNSLADEVSECFASTDILREKIRELLDWNSSDWRPALAQDVDTILFILNPVREIVWSQRA